LKFEEVRNEAKNRNSVMSGFELISPGGEDIRAVSSVPSAYQHLVLKGGHSFMFDCSFGGLLFNHYKGDGYDLWKSNYVIDRATTLIGRADVPLLELSVMYENSFSIDWRNVRKDVLPARQIELYYAPYMDNRTCFPPGKFTTVDFDLHRELLG
jgi:hypothetical protein